MVQLSASAVIMVNSTACWLIVRQYAGHAQAHRADVGVGRRIGIVRCAAAVHLAVRGQLGVDFQPDDRFIFRSRRSCHKQFQSISIPFRADKKPPI